MTTAIVYYSQHHGNTKKLLDAIKAADPSVELVDVTSQPTTDLSGYDRIGFASGIYFSAFASPIFQKRFSEAAAAVEEILHWDEEPFVTDLGVTTFTVTYADKTKATRDFILPGDDFKECFAIIKQMVPGCEYIPAVLLTSEDYSL